MAGEAGRLLWLSEACGLGPRKGELFPPAKGERNVEEPEDELCELEECALGERRELPEKREALEWELELCLLGGMEKPPL